MKTPDFPFIFGIFLSLFTLGSWSSASLAADNDQTDPQKLEQLRQQIQVLRSDLNSDVQRKQSLQSRLRRSERHIGKVVSLLKKLKHQLRTQQRELKTLNTRRSGLQSDLHKHRIALAQQIRAAYTIGQQEYVKILLNQQDPAAVARTLTYYDYFHRARLARMQDINENLAELRAVEKNIQQKTRKLEKTREEQNREKMQLEKTRQQRATVLAGLQQQIFAKGERLSSMEEDKRRLQGLLDSLATVPRQPENIGSKLISEGSEHTPFAKLRGQLPWPSRGQLITRYGSTRKAGKLKWQGVNIRAPEGTEVSAISHGRVAFSDWLRGFGLLIIIDHGDGYMSLYGGNQSLFKEVGDWVETGEVIASVGKSGGRKDSALYFEIRHNGKPGNPLKWCRNKPKRVSAS
ncbi:MAG: peptidoglycan DD-metalloendopeptidase family protein [Gammaproteobacteria bacterium]|nr:peptidoglycan DD-metalloendopeptidase family protein [Gammaproteobacteria bacterium]